MKEFIGSDRASVEDEVTGMFRVELAVQTERMKHMVSQHLFDHANTLREEADRHIKWMIDNNVIQTLIRETIDKATREAIDHAVSAAIRSAFYDPEFQAQLRRGLIKQLRQG